MVVGKKAVDKLLFPASALDLIKCFFFRHTTVCIWEIPHPPEFFGVVLNIAPRKRKQEVGIQTQKEKEKNPI